MRKLSLLLAVATGCASMMGSKSEPKSETLTAQSTAQQQYQGAADAQKRAADEQAKAESAQREVMAAQKSLADAQARAAGQQAKAEQAQAEAQKLARQAQEQGKQAQEQAVQSQTQQKDAHMARLEKARSWTDEKVIDGQLLESKGSALRIRSPDRRDLTLDLTDATAISIDGQQSGASKLQPGSDVRASYQMVDGRAKALKLEVRSNAQGQEEKPAMNEAPAQSPTNENESAPAPR